VGVGNFPGVPWELDRQARVASRGSLSFEGEFLRLAQVSWVSWLGQRDVLCLDLSAVEGAGCPVQLHSPSEMRRS
jgi:hypothetical protein